MGVDPNRAKSIFLSTVEYHTPEEWDAYIKEACQGDTELRRRVEALLAAHRGADRLLDNPGAVLLGTADAAEPIEAPGTVIGRYKLLEKIGEGGMAVVYMAEQTEPIRRKVALKIIKLGMDTRQVIARFEAERQALALMDHPCIAKVLDAGATETGRPYFVMELVTGVSITEYCDKNRLSTKERLALFLQVCQAVQHAHTKGIIHRDIKPSNVMVTHHDGKPIPKVIDFGITKAINQKLTEKTLFTRYAHIIGTPAYMSPEQAELSDLDIDTRSDIYSLGVLLYELLTGTTPFSEEELRKAGYIEMQRIIREQEPIKPSTRIRTAHVAQPPSAGKSEGSPPRAGVLQGRPGDRSAYQQVRGDLDWIVMKSLEKDRTRRYETASGLAEDIRRHLEHEPVLARGPGVAYRAQRFVRRYRAQVLIALAFALLIAMTAVIFSIRNRDRLQVVAAQHKALLSQAQGEYARGERQAALEAIQGIVDSKHVGPDARLLCASILVEDRRSEEAMALLSKLIHERAEIAGAAYALLARTIWEGPSLSPEEVRKAEEYQKKAEELLPQTAAAYYLRALAALTIHEKLDLLTEAVRLERDHYPSRRLQALIHLASRRYEDLKDDALMMTDRWPGDPLGYSLRAIAWRELGRYQNALADYEKALSLTPQDSPQYLDLAAQRGETLLRMRDYERAASEAEAYLKLFSDNPVLQYHLFAAWTALGDYERAETVSQQIIRASGESRLRFEDWRRKYVFDTLAAKRSWHPPGSKPAGAAFLPMLEAEETYQELLAKAKRVIVDGFSGQWSPHGDRLAFSAGVQGYSGVAVFDPATKETDLLIVPGKDPRWSPDGQHIAFVRDCQVLRVPEFVAAERRLQGRPSADEEVWVMNSDGTEPRRLAAGGSPSWGQDPTCVYYQSRVENTLNSISIVDRDAEPRQIMKCSYSFPSVSRHNRRVVCVEGGLLRLKDLDSQRSVAQWPCTMGVPEVSPLGDELCLKIYGVRNTTGLWIYRLDRREPVKVLGGQLNILGASWAPDGTKLVFWAGPPHFEIWSADLDPKVSTIESLAPGQTLEEDWRQMVRLCKRRIEADPLDAVAYSDRARCYDRLHEPTEAEADMKRWSAVVSARLLSSLDRPPTRADFTFGAPAHLDAALQFFPSSNVFVDCFSSDYREMFMCSDRARGQGGFDLWVLKRASVEDDWGPPENLGPNVNSANFDGFSSISRDGLDLYFLSNRPGGYGMRDLYVTRRATRTSPWGAATNLGPKVNSSYGQDGTSVSSDGLQLYFQSNRPGGYGKGDLYVSTRATTSDPWGDPVNLGPAVNSPFAELRPCLAPDGLLLFWYSRRPEWVFGTIDLWMMRRASRGAPWDPPVNLGPIVDSPNGDCRLCLAPDGSALYLAWSWPDGENIPWKVPIIPVEDSGGERMKGRRDQK